MYAINHAGRKSGMNKGFKQGSVFLGKCLKSGTPRLPILGLSAISLGV
jgi:hypothetical protein